MPGQYETPRADLDFSLPPRPYFEPRHPIVKPPYSQLAVISPAFNNMIVGGGIGLFVSAVKNSLENHNKGALGVFTRTGWIAGYLAMAGFAGSAARNTVANIRLSETDGVAGFSGGCAAGFVAGLKNGSLSAAMGMCGLLGGVMATYDLAGGREGWKGSPKRLTDFETREKERLSFFQKPKNEVSEE